MKARTSKNVIFILSFLGIGLISPLILAKMGFWESSFAAAPTTTATAPTNISAPASYANAVDIALPSVVSIQTKVEIPMDMHPMFRDPFFRQFFGIPNNPNMNPNMQQFPQKELQPGLGSGVIVDKRGYVLTNNHVIRDAKEISVRLNDGRTSPAKVVGVDPDTDLAVLKIELEQLPAISFGDSTHLRVGDVVLAIGNPFGVGQTVTQGIISATHRSELGINTFENFIQTDASINPGNSGGALIDTQGKIVGINTAIATAGGGGNVGIGFAIPIETAQEILSDLIEHGSVTRGWLGISIRPLTPELRDQLRYTKGEGVVVAGVVREGPAQRAGLTPGDIIVSLNNQPTPDPRSLLSNTAKLEPEKNYPVVIVRDGQTFDFKVRIGMRPKAPEPAPAAKPEEGAAPR